MSNQNPQETAEQARQRAARETQQQQEAQQRQAAEQNAGDNRTQQGTPEQQQQQQQQADQPDIPMAQPTAENVDVNDGGQEVPGQTPDAELPGDGGTPRTDEQRQAMERDAQNQRIQQDQNDAAEGNQNR